MAQYTALMVMKHHFGADAMKKFLRFELDQYLRGRANERNEENPLYKVDQNQGYIHYRKGSLAMYALQDYIGEDNVNAAIREFLKQYAFKGPPYPTSLDLESEFQKVTPPQYQYVFDDLFRNITLYDNRALSAEYTTLPDGKYQVNSGRRSEEGARGRPRPGAQHPSERLDGYRRAGCRRKVSLLAETQDRSRENRSDDYGR